MHMLSIKFEIVSVESLKHKKFKLPIVNIVILIEFENNV